MPTLGENQSHDCEGAEQDHREAPLGDRIGDDAFHRLIAVDHLLAAHLAAGAADGIEGRSQVSV